MENINKIIQDVEVEWKTLGELTELKQGRIMSKEYLTENAGEYPVYNGNGENNEEIGKIKTHDFDGEYIYWTKEGANAGMVFYINNKFSITNVCGLVKINDKNKLNYKFLYYWLSTKTKEYVCGSAGNPKLMNNQMEQIIIPIPALKTQEEIVAILDQFTDLTAKLINERKTRKQEYEHYREKLLSLNEKGLMFDNIEVEFKSLGELALLEQSFFIDLPFSTVDTICGADVKTDIITPRFLYHYLQTQYLKDLNTAGTVPNLTQTIINKIKIPVPPLEIQERIVQILDKFDTLVNSISEGLPKEIETSKKQYEHYKDQLMSFNH